MEDRRNLGTILKFGSGTPTPQELEQAFWSAYNNKARTAVKAAAKNSFGFVAAKLSKSTPDYVSGQDTWAKPRYEDILEEACKVVKAYERSASTGDLEVYLVQKLFVQCLFNMQPSERRSFLETEVDFDQVASGANVKTHLKGHVAALGAISAAQASGFGVYLLATTTLGAITQSLGITLPFVIYTGLTKAISIIIGPIGWAGLGFSVFWKLTGPDWKRLLPALVYIITVKYRPTGGESA